MSTDVKLEQLVALQASSVAIILALVTTAMSQPNLDKKAFIKDIDKHIAMMEKKGIDDALLGTLRTALLPLRIQAKDELKAELEAQVKAQ